MNTTAITLGIASVMTAVIIVHLGIFSLLSGALHFLFGRPSLKILKTNNGENGFAFGFAWNGAREPAKFDKVRLRLYNPFGSPTQVDLSKEFNAHDSSFAEDLDMGTGMLALLRAKGMKEATVEVELTSLKDGVTQYFRMKGREFFEKYKNATETVDDFNNEHKIEKPKKYYHQVSKSFVAEKQEKSAKTLKIASNPEFAAEFAANAPAAAAGVENFSVTKVWIEPGCIVCDACEGIYPEVFEVQADTCVIRPDAPLDDGLKITEAAEACPVEVIKFAKA